jgi:succinyl-CoA synthetase beta subunit
MHLTLALAVMCPSRAGKRILKESGMAIIAADDLDDAAQKAVASLK